MHWEAIGAIGEVVGAAAVVATLIYLARQVRQSNAVAAAQAFQDRALTRMHLHHDQANPKCHRG